MATLYDYYSRIPRRTLNLDITQYGIQNFIETGTGLGDTVDYITHTSKTPLTVYSVEIHKEIADRARARFKDLANCTIVNNTSYDGLKEILPLLEGNSIFFLDAHFPGADFGYAQYSDAMEYDKKLPLEKELELLHSSKNTSKDIILIDDLRIYEEGTFEMGNWSKENGAVHTGVQFVYDLFSSTHTIEKHYFYSGFITLLPKQFNR